MNNFYHLTRTLIHWLLLSIAFLLPFKHLLSVAIGVLLLMVLINGNLYRQFFSIFRNRIVLFSVLFYVAYIIGMLKSENLKYGLLDVETKLSILLLPVIFAGIEKPSKTFFYRISWVFCLGCISALLVCLARSVFLFNENGFDGFFYQRLSWFIHPGYFAMYLNYCICFLIHEIVFGDRNSEIRKILFPVTIFLIAGLLLLSSKAGTLLLLLTLLATIIFLLYRRKPVKILVSLILILTGALVFTVSTPEVFKRWNEMSNTISGTVEENQGHTTGLRLKTWEGSIRLIMEQPLTGVGTGDVKDALIKKYEELNMPDLVAMRLNAHNQFMQTTIALGFIGLGILVLLFYYSFRQFLRTRNFLATAFMVIILFNAMIESILEVQAGVIFFAFFLGVHAVAKDASKDLVTT